MAAKSGRKTIFFKKLPVDSADTLRVKNFVEIALSRSVSKTNWFLHLTQKFKMAAKIGGKMIFAKSYQYTCRYPALQSFRQNCSILLRFRDKCSFAFSALRKIVTFSKLLISQPFCIGSLPKVHDFHLHVYITNLLAKFYVNR